MLHKTFFKRYTVDLRKKEFAMSLDDTIVIRSLNNLIEYSTDFRFTRRRNFKQLHISLIKHFFNVPSAVLDNDQQTVCLGLEMLEREAEICLSYTNLEKFLKSCIRDTPENMQFYKNILHYYSLTEAVA